MDIQDILSHVEQIDSNRSYWFIRTESGTRFDEFYKGNYVGIGWDYITLYDIQKSEPETVKAKIARHENRDLSNRGDKTSVSISYGRMKAFTEVKKGDVVVIPGEGSDELAFGIIQDERPYEEVRESAEFRKRRHVKWIEKRSLQSLGPIFYQVKRNQHTISSIDSFSPYIDRVMSPLFRKGDYLHYVLKIDSNDDISFDELNGLLTEIKDICNVINDQFQLDENIDEMFLKISLESPGLLELKRIGKSLSILGILLYLTSCGDLEEYNNADGDSFERTVYLVDPKLESIRTRFNTLNMDTTQIEKQFTHYGH